MPLNCSIQQTLLVDSPPPPYKWHLPIHYFPYCMRKRKGKGFINWWRFRPLLRLRFKHRVKSGKSKLWFFCFHSLLHYFPIINVCSLSYELCHQAHTHRKLCYFQNAAPVVTSAAQPCSSPVIQQNIYCYFHMSELCPLQRVKLLFSAWVPKVWLLFQSHQMPVTSSLLRELHLCKVNNIHVRA